MKREIHRCPPCQKAFKAPTPQKMAAPPSDRVDICAPFEVTAMDVCGPFMVRNGRATQKRWILVFTCMTCRAVHFEVLKDMTSATFINALIRFHSRRPGLRTLYSDNAANFRGAERELRMAIQSFRSATAGEFL